MANCALVFMLFKIYPISYILYFNCFRFNNLQSAYSGCWQHILALTVTVISRFSALNAIDRKMSINRLQSATIGMKSEKDVNTV